MPSAEALAPCGGAVLLPMIGAEFEALMRVELLGPVRVIRPGQAVTEDYMPARLNIYLDDADRVQTLGCG